MADSARESYLETEILTAPPQKLHFMLIDATIRAVERTRQLWQAGQDEEACKCLIGAQQIITEMISGLKREMNEALAKKAAAIYLFVFRKLLEANLEHDEEKLADALRVLETERETWRQVCEQLGRTDPSRPTSDSDQPFRAAPTGGHGLTDELPPNVSLEA
jgi:flagellar protein FliS